VTGDPRSKAKGYIQLQAVLKPGKTLPPIGWRPERVSQARSDELFINFHVKVGEFGMDIKPSQNYVKIYRQEG